MDAEGMAEMLASLKVEYFREFESTVYVGDVSWFLMNWIWLILAGIEIGWLKIIKGWISWYSFPLTVDVLVEMDAEGMAKMFASLTGIFPEYWVNGLRWWCIIWSDISRLILIFLLIFKF